MLLLTYMEVEFEDLVPVSAAVDVVIVQGDAVYEQVAGQVDDAEQSSGLCVAEEDDVAFGGYKQSLARPLCGGLYGDDRTALRSA